jgi:signal transduction histidine kinase
MNHVDIRQPTRELRLQHLFQQSFGTFLLQAVAAICLVYILYPHLERRYLGTGVTLFILFLLFRGLLTERFHKNDNSALSGGDWILGMTLAVCWSGVLWGSLLFETMSVPDFERNISMLWIAGLALGASSSLSAFPWLYCIFALLSMGPTTLALLIGSNAAGNLAAIAVLLFVAYSAANVLFMHRSLLRTIVLVEKIARTEMRLRERHKLDAVSQLTAGIAHNYNNLLTVIIGNVEALRTCVHPGNLEFVDNAMAAALDASHLTDSLNTFSQNQTLAVRPIQLGEIMDRFAKIVTPMLGSKIVLRAATSPDDLWAEADPAQLEIALTNIVLNAMEAMPEGGELKLVLTRASVTGRRASDDTHAGLLLPADLRPGDYAVIEITDTGVGMSEEVRLRAVEPFFTTRLPAQSEGLGLSIVHGFVKQSRGDILIRSQPGIGTRVSIFLPLLGSRARDVGNRDSSNRSRHD